MTARPKPGAAADPLVWSFTYAADRNLMTSSTNPLGQVTTFAYDANSNLTRTELPMVDGDTPFVEYIRNGRGQAEQISRAEGLVRTMTYDDGTGDLTGTVTDPAGLALTDSYIYDGIGNLTEYTDRRGGQWTYEWYPTRRLKTTTNPLGHITQYTYDADGNLLTVSKETGDTHAPWQTTAFAYTLGGQRAGLTGPRGEISTMDYDELGRLWQTTDPLGRVSELEYDALGRVSRRIGPLPGQEVGVTYTPNGEVAALADAAGNGLAYAYDGFDRLERGTYADGSFEEHGYDKAGNRTGEQTRAGSVIDMTHDPLDRLRTRTLPGGSVRTFSYDLNDRLVQVADAHGTYSQEFDAAGRLTVATSPGGRELRYGYDADGNTTSLTHPDGFVVTYAYDELGRMTDIFEGDTTLLAHYEYDRLSRRVSVAYANGATVAYSYDIGNNLTSLQHGFSDASIGFTYTYDSTYNQVSAACDNSALEYTSSPGTLHCTSNELNQLVTANGRALSYDTNGNLIADEVNTYGFDVENLLRTVATPAHTAAYEYDPFGRRRSKTVDGVIRSYAYDGPHAVVEYDGGGQVVRRTVYGPRIDEPVRISSPAGTHYYHADHLGTIVALSDSNGELAETYAYSPFGRPARTSGVGNPLLYTGRDYDEETGLYYYRARYYSPELSRFLSPDPLGPASGDLNAYAYCLNNPVMYTDPSGQFLVQVPIVAAAMVWATAIVGTSALITAQMFEIHVPYNHPLGEAAAVGPLILVSDAFHDLHPALQRSIMVHERQHRKWDWWQYIIGAKTNLRAEMLAYQRERDYLLMVERPRYEKKGATEALELIDKEINDINNYLANDNEVLRDIPGVSPYSAPSAVFHFLGKAVTAPLYPDAPVDSLQGWEGMP